MASTTKDTKLEDLEAKEMERLMINPNLALTDSMFMLTCVHANDQEKEASTQKLMEAVKKYDMAPFYEYLCEEYKFAKDDKLLKEMKGKNDAELKRIDAVIADALEYLGETEIREAHLEKAEYLCIIGNKEAAIGAFDVAFEKTVSLGQRLDIVLNLIRLGMFFSDKKLTEDNFAKAESLMKDGGDWDRRNRLKVYSAIYAVSVRDFKKASSLVLDTVSTFTCQEVMTYKRYVDLGVIMGLYALDRVDLKEKVVNGPEIQEMLHESPIVKAFLDSFVGCNYAQFYASLVEIDAMMAKDSVLAAHKKHYIREMRVLAYAQLLQSYRSVTLDSMAKSFGVSVDFIDTEIANFVAAGRLNCKIDKVGGIIVTNRPDSKNAQYQASIKQGDILLNRIQKLSQVIKI